MEWIVGKSKVVILTIFWVILVQNEDFCLKKVFLRYLGKFFSKNDHELINNED